MNGVRYGCYTLARHKRAGGGAANHLFGTFRGDEIGLGSRKIGVATQKQKVSLQDRDILHYHRNQPGRVEVIEICARRLISVLVTPHLYRRKQSHASRANGPQDKYKSESVLETTADTLKCERPRYGFRYGCRNTTGPSNQKRLQRTEERRREDIVTPESEQSNELQSMPLRRRAPTTRHRQAGASPMTSSG
jgi:hypothetical protein